MNQYLSLMRRVLDAGERRGDRTGVGTRSLFGEHMCFDLAAGFPAVTTKRLAFGQVVAELAGFLEGSRDVARFRELGCTVWDGNAAAPYWASNPNRAFEGDLGRVYGVQWRAWRGAAGTAVDQLAEAVRLLREDPDSRRVCVTAWNPAELDEMCLPPCHLYFQFSARAGRRLDCLAVMRSVDVLLGMPFDIASYALLTHIVAGQVGMTPGHLTMSFGDTHIYNNHVRQCEEQLSRRPFPLPRLELDPSATVDNFVPSMARLTDYRHHEPIRAELNV